MNPAPPAMKQVTRTAGTVQSLLHELRAHTFCPALLTSVVLCAGRDPNIGHIVEWPGHDIAAADVSGFANQLIEMLMRSRIRSTVEPKYDAFERKIGRDGQNGVDEMNPAGGLAHSQRLAHHLHDLLVGQVVKRSNADDVIERCIFELEPRAIHHHEAAVEMGTRHLDIVGIDIYTGILASEAVAIVARAASDIEQRLAGARIYLLADQRAKPVGGRL